MSYDPTSILKRDLDRMARGGEFAKQEALDLFRRIRLVLDARSLRPVFPYASMYCDWLQHLELDRNPGVLPLVEAIDSVFSADPSTASLDHELKTIHDALGLTTLRREMIDLFTQLSLPTSLLTSMSNWYTLMEVMLEDLTGRPLILGVPPKGAAAKATLARMSAKRRARGLREDRHLYKVLISDRRTAVAEPGRPPGFYFTLFLSPAEGDRIQINGHWGGQEKRDAFTED